MSKSLLIFSGSSPWQAMHFSANKGLMCMEKSFSPTVGSSENAQCPKDIKTIRQRRFILNKVYPNDESQQFSNDEFSR
jgi:hypothetical protein